MAQRLKLKTDTIKLLEERIGKTFSHKSYRCFLRLVSQSKRNRSRNKQIRPNQTYKLLHSKGNHKQNEKTTYGLGENICK